jgi:DNA-binding CsgD family transcriptional regulator
MTQAISMEEATAVRHMTSLSVALLARLEATLGLDERCRHHVDEAIATSSHLGVALVTAWARSAIGLLELADQRPDAAADHFDAVALLASDVGEPGWLWWQADAVEAYVGAGRRDDAHAVFERLQQQADATGRSWAVAAAARCRTLLGAEGDPDELLTAAVDGFAAATIPFEQARTLLQRGERRARDGRTRDGGRDIAEARTIFDRLGARRWSDRASTLRGEAASQQPSVASRLTAAELRVAMAMVNAETYKDAAEQLFLSVKTVDFHLRNIYKKLGIRSQHQLVRLVLAETS